MPMWNWWAIKSKSPIIIEDKEKEMINKVAFYEKLREEKLFNTLSQRQVDSIDVLLSECERQGVDDMRQIAYILATPYHECYNWLAPDKNETRMTPMSEVGGLAYLKSKKYYPYYGRGFSHLTWEENYKKEAKRTGIDIVKSPDLLNTDLRLAANSHVYCMVHGSYTGKKLSDYINKNGCDFINSRRIINGTDKAELIMSYAQKFLSCLTV